MRLGTTISIGVAVIAFHWQFSVLVLAFLPHSTRFQLTSTLTSRTTRWSFRSYCIDKQFKELAPVEIDADDTWRTKPTTIVPIDKDFFTTRPEVITFDAVNTLIQPSQSIGRWYREALHSVLEMRVRLPRPALFTAAYKKAYAAA
jgi:hypothetical protein